MALAVSNNRQIWWLSALMSSATFWVLNTPLIQPR